MAEETLDPAELLRLASAEDKEAAAEPVAVESSDWMDEARLLVSEVMEFRADETSDEAEDRRDEIADPIEEVTLAAELASVLLMLMLMLDEVVVVSWAWKQTSQQ